MSTRHSLAAAGFLKDREKAGWHDKTLWMVREKRDRMSRELPEWEQLRDAACALKMYSNSHLAELLEQFEENASRNGAIVHWASDAREYRETVLNILQDHGARLFIKSKSMLAEECELTPYLEENGIETVESDLGERIVQLMHVKPSHIVLPAVHIRREEIGKLFEKEMGTEPGNSDPTYLTHAARKNLRQIFKKADAAMTGGNFAVASTGEVVVCTNEGNADIGTSLHKLQIAAFGLEKIVPDPDSLGVFTRLLARSGTGQPVTTYTTHYSRPQEGGEFHIIIVDNGRSRILAEKGHSKTLNCLRCGACMNTCPVYRRSGGYSYTYFIPGPIGINLSMLKNPEKYHDNVSACSLCMSCSNVCPAKVDLGEQIYLWRQSLDGLGKADRMKKFISDTMEIVMEHPAVFNTALKIAPVVNSLPRPIVYCRMDTWGAGRELPEFARESFNRMWKSGKVKGGTGDGNGHEGHLAGE
ncbi:MAG: lactate utilization protein [Bacteroidetes bacterium]|uniref:Lactate utilization protein n=1 Tax=Candidatus Cryptobacteroides excrementipullorum TaxID=2840761 RepID=A0A9D9ITQ4_9BACT|nr:lactate utilization protein [Candidatus Cryptobacteroides excrementipullorum]